ncbi:MAG: tripartite tricarboxylate transporter substrate-binding protein [Acetobacteraceae bacterium]|nr:tripartite tricarboxylate transporter substrate-binding protein [Acetobacteraceae bacterium]MCX7684877.1 tripartite tricarboxylate transporter substrate-binding protein [Acetobacteraceae bacterium]MDW8397927.1 tripartite tricarboxylate transporter substrate-binding protein [Acetobacteraceae bacterium]
MTAARSGRRRILAAGGGALLVGALAAPALAAPQRRTLTLLVGAPAGSPTDLRARSLVPFLERHLTRHTIVVGNLPGTGGLEAARQVAGAGGASSMLGIVSTPALLARCIQDADPDLPDRLAWFGPLLVEPLLLVAGPDGQGLRLVANGRDGRVVGCGPAGSGSHLAAIRLAAALPGVRVLPFASSAAAQRAAAAGHIAAALLPAPDLRRAITVGGVLPVAVAAASRLSWLPAVPTLAERGLPLVAAVERGLVAPAGLSAASRLAAAILNLRADPEFVAWTEELGARPGEGDPAAWATRLAEERRELAAQWSRMPWVEPG